MDGIGAASLPRRCSVLETMLLAATPGRGMLWRARQSETQPDGIQETDRGGQLFKSSQLPGPCESKPLHKQSKEFDREFAEFYKQEFKAKEVLQQATFKKGREFNDRRNQRKTKHHGKGKGRLGHHAVDGQQVVPKPIDRKRTVKEVSGLVKSPTWIADARNRLRSKLFAATTSASKESKRRKVVEIMDSCDIKFQGNGISCDELLTVAAVLGESGIKSADQYLAEVKLMQLESGVSWTDVLERQLSMVKRALKRDIGPESRAKEVNPELIPWETWESNGKTSGQPVRTAWAYGWATVWMLRCVELVNMRLGDVL